MHKSVRFLFFHVLGLKLLLTLTIACNIFRGGET